MIRGTQQINTAEFLRSKADRIRGEAIEIPMRNDAGHIAPSLSCVDILVAMYYGVMSYKPEHPLWEERDRLIFSKAHGCYSLYAILADKGIIPRAEWTAFFTPGSGLPGCLERKPEYGIEAGCGALGHGLPIAVGVAFGARLRRQSHRVFCVTGDGELQEGSTWEALQFAVKHEINNLMIVIDRNRLQAMDFTSNVLDRSEDDLISRLRGFGLNPVTCPGHDAARLAECMRENIISSGNEPQVIIADTVKGFGLKCMENVPKFHFRVPNDEELGMGRTYDAAD
ncbi:MAG: transketolase [Candidatus Omnitrophota bacterium]